jgi:hypothetical protein
MAHIREVRPHACELKFLLRPAVAAGIREWARSHLSADANGTGPFGDEYRTTSVYFDNAGYDVFHRRGSFGRSKYRIRRYGDEETVFLERKLRQPAVLAKRRTTVALSGLRDLSAPADPAWAGYWFHRRVAARQLRPVCQLSYFRMARAVVRDGEQVRLTLDSDLAVLPVASLGFPPGVGVPVLADRLILELKFRGTPPALFRQLVEEFALSPQATSKYRLGVAALGQVTAQHALPPTGTEAFYA